MVPILRIKDADGNLYEIPAIAGGGDGDMLKSTYDKNGNGVVDNAEKLGGELPSAYRKTADAISYSDLTGKPSAFPPTAHIHEMSDVTGLSDELQGKADAGELEELSEALGQKAEKSIGADIELLPANWIGTEAPYHYTLETGVIGVDPNRAIILSPSHINTVAAYEAIMAAQMLCESISFTAQTATIRAQGEKPEIPVTVHVEAVG